jgi:hypothetical protein
MKRHLVFVVSLLLLIACGCSAKTEQAGSARQFKINGDYKKVGDYSETEERLFDELCTNGLDSYVLYDSSELTLEILENRNGITIIERCIGVVTDKAAGDGKTLNAPDEMGDYIGYRSIGHKIYDGTVILTYFVYNPGNNYFDDITDRYDFVLCREWED